MYYENEKESVFHPKGVWCLDDCRVGMMKRPGLGEKQACLLRGKRELVITADSLEELKAWNKAVQQARKYTPTRFADLEQRAQQEAAKLQRQVDSTIVELELTRSKLREERQNMARMQGELAAAKEAGYKLEANVQEAERRQSELRSQMDAEFAARDEAMRQVVEMEAARADSAVEALETERRNRTPDPWTAQTPLVLPTSAVQLAAHTSSRAPHPCAPLLPAVCPRRRLVQREARGARRGRRAAQGADRRAARPAAPGGRGAAGGRHPQGGGDTLTARAAGGFTPPPQGPSDSHPPLPSFLFLSVPPPWHG